MLIQRLQKWWIENPSLLNCLKAIQDYVSHGFTGAFEPPFGFSMRQMTTFTIEAIFQQEIESKLL
jgi:hypothetical protein